MGEVYPNFSEYLFNKKKSNGLTYYDVLNDALLKYFSGKEVDSKYLQVYVNSWRNSMFKEELDEVPAYRTGINYISQDQIAMLHKGEAVVPERFNPAAHETELSRLRSKEQENVINSNNDLIAAIKDIKSFLDYWKRDGDTKELARSIESRMLNRSNGLVSTMA